MTKVLLYAEHALSDSERTSVLQALVALPFDDVEVTVIVPFQGHSSGALMDEISASRGASVAAAVGDMRHDNEMARAAARRHLDHVVGDLRAAGIEAYGELVPTRDQVKDLVAEVTWSHAEAALVVAGRHGVAHLLHRDLEHRLRQVGLAPVIAVGTVPQQRAP